MDGPFSSRGRAALQKRATKAALKAGTSSTADLVSATAAVEDSVATPAEATTEAATEGAAS